MVKIGGDRDAQRQLDAQGLIRGEGGRTRSLGLVGRDSPKEAVARLIKEEEIAAKHKTKKPRQGQLTAMDFLKGVRFDKGYIEPLVDDVYGVGRTYNGLYYVDSVTHSFTAGGYRESFKLKRNTTE